MKHRIFPLGDRILVRPIFEHGVPVRISDFGPDSLRLGEVVEVGEGKVLEDGTIKPLEVKVGDQIIFDCQYTTAIDIYGDMYFLLKEPSIEARVYENEEKKKIVPVGNNILVRALDVTETTLHIDPSNVLEGEVVGVGEEVDSSKIKEGTLVIFDRCGSPVMELRGDNFFIVRPAAILATYEKQPG